MALDSCTYEKHVETSRAALHTSIVDVRTFAVCTLNHGFQPSFGIRDVYFLFFKSNSLDLSEASQMDCPDLGDELQLALS